MDGTMVNNGIELMDITAMVRNEQASAESVIQSVRCAYQTELFSAQYVYHPSSETGVYLAVYFVPESGIDAVLVTVPNSWIVWQL